MTQQVYLPTSVAWPEEVPPPFRWKLSTGPLPTKKNRKTESGRIESRRFGSGEPDKLEAVWMLTSAEYKVFCRFYEGPAWYADDGVRLDCQLGTVWITATWLWELGYYNHEVRFWGSPRARRFGTAVEVTATMLIQHEDRIVREWPKWEWTCFPLTARVTKQYSEQLIQGHPTIRNTKFYSEQLVQGIPNARVTNLYTEVLCVPRATARVTNLYSEVLFTPVSKPRITNFYTEVLCVPRSTARITQFYSELLLAIQWGGGPGSEGGLFDGTCRIISGNTDLFDGRVHLGPDHFDGKAYVYKVGENVFDGKAVVQTVPSGTDQFDGKAEINMFGTEAFDGKALVKDEATGVFDGYAIVQDTNYARVTQQYAEVGYTGTDPSARVTQQYAEVGYLIYRDTDLFSGKVVISS